MALRKNPKVDLRRKYARTMEIGFILSLSVLILAFYSVPHPIVEETKQKNTQELFTAENVIQTIEEKLPEPPKKPPRPIEATTDDPIEDIILDNTEIDNNNIPDSPPELPVIDNTDDDELVDFWAIEEKPEPVGGLQSIYQNLVYPEIAVKARIQGLVVLEAIVNKDGTLSDIKVVKGIGGGCEESALKALKNVMFNPGMQRGRPVNVKINIPIKFMLSN